MKELITLVRPEQRLEIVDVGAADLEHGQKPPYLPLVQAGAARVTGFEPNPDEFAKLPQTENRRYLPYALGQGGQSQLYITQTPGFCSTLAPNAEVAALIHGFSAHMALRDSLAVDTQRLDDLDQVEAVDCLKIDIQGGETAVFAGGQAKLARCLVVQTEVAFWPFYENQPSFADQDRALQALGLQFFAMQSVNRFPLAGVPQRLRRQSRRRDAGPWVDGDALYVRQIAQWPGLSTRELQHLLLLLACVTTALSAVCYLADLLQARGALGAAEVRRVQDIVAAGGPWAPARLSPCRPHLRGPWPRF